MCKLQRHMLIRPPGRVGHLGACFRIVRQTGCKTEPTEPSLPSTLLHRMQSAAAFANPHFCTTTLAAGGVSWMVAVVWLAGSAVWISASLRAQHGASGRQQHGQLHATGLSSQVSFGPAWFHGHTLGTAHPSEGVRTVRDLAAASQRPPVVCATSRISYCGAESDGRWECNQ